MAPTSPPTLDLGEYLLPEESIAEKLGITRAQVRAARGSENGRWVYGPCRRVLWSHEGFQALQEEILAPCREKSAPPDGAEVLVVWNPRVPNRKTLVAVRKGQAADAPPEDRCIVYLGNNGDNRRFTIGMEILARFHRGASWHFEGNPAAPEKGRQLPRFAGRW